MSIAALFNSISSASTEETLAAHVLDVATQMTGACRVGYYMLDGTKGVGIHVRGMPTAEIDAYERHGRGVDALHAWVLANHVPARMDLDDLKRFPAFRRFAMQYDVDTTLGEYMLAPVVHGGVASMMHFATPSGRPFPTGALRFATALSTHASARLAVLRVLDSLDGSWAAVLSAREREVAHLAARGLSTDHMARAAGVSPNTIKKHLKSLYAKLEVGSRAELGACLVRGPDAPTSKGRSTGRRAAARTPGKRA